MVLIFYYLFISLHLKVLIYPTSSDIQYYFLENDFQRFQIVGSTSLNRKFNIFNKLDQYLKYQC